MLAFELFVDDQRICLAGIEDWSVLSVIVSAVRSANPCVDDGDRVGISVGGLTRADADGVSYHARWGRIDLEVENRATISLVDTDQPDPPIHRYRSDREVQEEPFTEEETEEMEREQWLRLKAKFESEDAGKA